MSSDDDNQFDDYVKPKTKEEDRDRKVRPKFSKVKEEMQTLYVNEESQKLIMDTLRYIHGPNFELNDIANYKNNKTRLKDKFWINTGSLVVKGATNYSKSTVLTAADTFRLFSVNKLKSYGFYESHCQEVLSYFKEDIDSALVELYSKYHRLNKKLDADDVSRDISTEELLQQRLDEKDVLQSIYETAFVEKDLNNWTLTFKLDYLVELHSNKKSLKDNSENLVQLKKTPLCRNFSRTGQCKFGSRCRFSHIEPKIDQQSADEDFRFELEIRFLKDSKYPYEPPVILLSTNYSAMPKINLLFICHRLIEEATMLAADGIVSVYSICELLKNSEEMINFLNTTKMRFIEEDHPVIPATFGLDENTNEIDLPSHYEKGSKVTHTVPDQQIAYYNSIIFRNYEQKAEQMKYHTFLKMRRKLPAWNKREDILKHINGSQVVVISGETGCGKSTQIPQYILDQWLDGNDPEKRCEIICTQPRRLSAIGVAERVATERTDRIGSTVGYQIRLETKISELTRLIFCTTGILLQRLQSDPCLKSVTHIIVDEVHERSDESDFLLLILKTVLPIRKDLKVILMSATVNASLFSNYFGEVPVLNIPGRTFPVRSYYLEEILEEVNYTLEQNSTFARSDIKGKDLEEHLATADVLKENKTPSPGMKDDRLSFPQILARYKDYSTKTAKNIYLMDLDKINNELIESVLLWIIYGSHNYPKEGTVLIFLPGFSEISSLMDYLHNTTEFAPHRQNKYLILPLHSTLTHEEQSAVFRKPPDGARKIILSTNIAETSITIDDCVFVIDSGKMKEKRFDSNKNMESLDTVWISRANALQRRGRAGRVMPGVCIHLYTSYRFKHFLGQPIPELHRIPLEQIILRIKSLSMFEDRSVLNVLQNIIEPPVVENVNLSICRLQDIGALGEQEILTPLGHHLAALPVDVRIGKLILFGAMFCCVDSSLTIAACLSFKSPFVKPFGMKKEVDIKKKEFITANSDQLTVLKAYQKWKTMVERSNQAAYNFTQENYLSTKTLMTIADIKHQLLDLLISIGFIPLSKKVSRRTGQDRVLEIVDEQFNQNGQNSKLLAAILCAALYPNIVKVLTPGKSYQKCIGGTVPTVPNHEDLKFVTLQDGRVAIHPSSVNSKVGHFPSPYLVYQEKLKTSRIFVRETCMIPPLPLALFAGCTLHVEVHSGFSVISLDNGWIIFQTETHEVAEMLKGIRIELNKILEEKIKDPCLNLLNHREGKRVISTIVDIITNN